MKDINKLDVILYAIEGGYFDYFSRYQKQSDFYIVYCNDEIATYSSDDLIRYFDLLDNDLKSDILTDYLNEH